MAKFTDKPGYAFSSDPPPEVSAFLKGKSNLPSFSWQDVEPEEHAVSFTVAKAMQADVLESIRKEVQRAIDEGRTLTQFRQDLKPRLQKLGWWGKQEMTDPVTGEKRKVQLGSPRRLRTIYRANLRSARAAGQWDRIQRTKAALPYLLYLLGPSEKHRPTHAAKEGMVLPVDHPFWASWYPPNGWGCKCHVRQITAREAERRGISADPPTDTVDHVNPRTGETRKVSKGLDPAWSNNPGLARMRNIDSFLDEHLETKDAATARAAVQDIVQSYRFSRVFAGSAPGTVPIGVAPAGTIADARQAVRIGASNAGMAKVGADGRRRHPEVSQGDYARVQEALEHGRIVREPGGNLRLFTMDDAGKWWRLVLKVRDDGVFVQTLHRSNETQAMRLREGDELVRE